MAISYTPEDLHDHHGVGAVITNENGEILMQEHVKFGFWTIPVGKVKKGQDIQQGLAQELLEECNIIVENCQEIATKDFKYIRNEKHVTVLGHIFTVLRYSGTIKNKEPHKHKQQLFMSIRKIQTLPVLSDLTLLYLEHNGIHRPKNISLQ